MAHQFVNWLADTTYLGTYQKAQWFEQEHLGHDRQSHSMAKYISCNNLSGE